MVLFLKSLISNLRLFYCCVMDQCFFLQLPSSWSLDLQVHQAEEQQKSSIWPDAQGWCPKIGVLAWEHTEEEHAGSAAVGNAAKRAAVTWLAKADFPAKDSDEGRGRAIAGRRGSVSPGTICRSSAARGRSVGRALPAREGSSFSR